MRLPWRVVDKAARAAPDGAGPGPGPEAGAPGWNGGSEAAAGAGDPVAEHVVGRRLPVHLPEMLRDAGPDTRLYAVVTGAAYGALAMLGAIIGLIGSFNYSWTAGGVPVAALLLAAGNFGVLLSAGRGMGGKLGALVPAAAWMLVIIVMQTRRPEGDLPITGTVEGYLFIVGGMVAAGLAIVVTPSSGPPGAWLAGRRR